jgi:hypothetical protein
MAGFALTLAAPLLGPFPSPAGRAGFTRGQLEFDRPSREVPQPGVDTTGGSRLGLPEIVTFAGARAA